MKPINFHHEPWDEHAGFMPPPPPPAERPGFVPPPPPPENCPPPTPVPPPIPPVRYVPGMNVQEQLGNMADRVNVAINRWNEIQRNCYQALDNVVGAAVNNDVYYAPDEVRYMEGYDENSGCNYAVVEARAVDRAGRPIFCHLRPAYNNETNSGAREPITDVSFVTSAQMAMTAVQATETRWKGTTVFNSNPGASTPDTTTWVAGWNRNGVLRFFPGDVSQDMLRQNRMVNCIGPVFPVLSDGQKYSAVLDSMGTTPGSVQAMGWKKNGNKVFFSCGCYDQPGMSPEQVAVVLQSMGCITAVITSYQTTAVTAWDANPIAGTESAMTYANDDTVISVPGMTGGMTFLGKLANAPLQWSIPQNCAAWYISKRSERGWRNSFTTEVANVVQRLGNQENSMSSILGQLEGENTAISKLQYDVQQNANDIAEVKSSVSGFDERISAVEEKTAAAEAAVATLTTQVNKLTTDLSAEVETRKQQFSTLQTGLANETAERQSADQALKASIDQEAATRKSQDTILQNNIDTEAAKRAEEDQKIIDQLKTEENTRATADRNLQQSIEAEQSARSTKDTELDAKIDAAIAQASKDNTELAQQVAEIQSGEGLPIASKSKLGAVKIGDNLVIASDGTLSAMAGGSGGDSIAAGNGIDITETQTGVKVVSIDGNTVATKDDVTAAQTKLENDIATVDQKVDATNTAVDGLKSELETVKENQESGSTEIEDIKQNIADIESGAKLPVATADTLGGVKIGANLSISEDGVLSATGGGSGETQDPTQVAQGDGISVEYAENTNTYSVSLAQSTKDKLAEVDAVKASGEANADAIASAQGDIAQLQEKASDTETEIAAIKEDVTDNETAIAKNAKDISDTNAVVQAVNTATVKAQGDATKALEEVVLAEASASAAQQDAEKAQETADSKVAKTGDTMSGPLTLAGAKLLLADAQGNVIGEIGATEGGILTLQTSEGASATLRGIATPTNASDATNKAYVDSEVGAVLDAAQEAQTQASEASEKAVAAQSAANAAKTAAENAQASADAINPDNFVKKTGDVMSGSLTTGSEYTATLGNGGVNVATGSRTLSGIGYINSTQGVVRIAVANSPKLALSLSNNMLSLQAASQDYTSKNFILSGLKDPVSANDAANKAYVDDKIPSIIIASGQITNFSISCLAFNNCLQSLNVRTRAAVTVPSNSTYLAQITLNVAPFSIIRKFFISPTDSAQSIFGVVTFDGTTATVFLRNLNANSLTIGSNINFYG